MNLKTKIINWANKYLATFGIIYFLIGLVFAILFALFYHWEFFSLFSPQFYSVVITWPIQFPGFLHDFQIYGLAGKTLT